MGHKASPAGLSGEAEFGFLSMTRNIFSTWQFVNYYKSIMIEPNIRVKKKMNLNSFSPCKVNCMVTL